MRAYSCILVQHQCFPTWLLAALLEPAAALGGRRHAAPRPREELSCLPRPSPTVHAPATYAIWKSPPPPDAL